MYREKCDVIEELNEAKETINGLTFLKKEMSQKLDAVEKEIERLKMAGAFTGTSYLFDKIENICAEKNKYETLYKESIAENKRLQERVEQAISESNEISSAAEAAISGLKSVLGLE
jgi:hypothetical protein